MEKLKNRFAKILRKTEKYAGTDMVYLTKSGSFLMMQKLIAAIAAFLIYFALANFMPPEILGEYKYILSIVAILGIFTLNGINTAVSRSIAKGYEAVTFKAIIIKKKYALFATTIALIIGLYYLFLNNFSTGFSFIIVAIIIPFFNTYSLYSAFLQGKKDFASLAKYSSIIETSFAVIFIVALYLTNNLPLLITIFLGTYSLFRFLAWKKTSSVIKKFEPDEGERRKNEQETISYGKHLTLMNVIGTVAKQIDKVILWHFLGAVPVALYSIASAFPNEIKIFSKAINSIAFPKFSSQDNELTKKTLPSKIFKYFLLLIPVTVLYIITAPLLFKIFFPLYTDAVIYSQVLAISIIFTPQMLLLTYLKARAKKKQLYIANVIAPSIRILLLLLLTPLFGIFGVIAAIITARLINFIVLLVLFYKN